MLVSYVPESEKWPTTPITYRGFPSGRRPVQVSTLESSCQLHLRSGSKTQTYTLQKSSFASPPERPPMAIPGVSRATISVQHFSRNSKSNPPWIIQNKFCFSGYWWDSMHRSSHRTERCMASLILAWSGEVVAITSSNCMMISDPIEFCKDIECSGVRSLTLY